MSCPVFDIPLLVAETAGSSISITSSFAPSPKPPIPSFVIMSSLATTSSISCSTNGISSGNHFRQTSGVAGHVGANGLPPEPGSIAASAVTLEVDDASVAAPSVWDFEHIQRIGTLCGAKSWKCSWCNQTFKHWNATKVLYHLTKIQGKDVRICRAIHDPASKALYKSLLKDKDLTSFSMKKRDKEFTSLVGEGQRSLAVMFEQSHKCISRAGGPKATGTTGLVANYSGKQQCDVVNCDVSVEASTSSQLTMAIMDFIHSTGLSFSATQGPHFQNILKFAHGVPANYKPPA